MMARVAHPTTASGTDKNPLSIKKSRTLFVLPLENCRNNGHDDAQIRIN
jgi:hypothetical protein